MKKGKFNVADEVRVIEIDTTTQKGVVTEVHGDECFVQLSDGHGAWFKESELEDA